LRNCARDFGADARVVGRGDNEKSGDKCKPSRARTRNPMYLALCLLQVALGFFLNDWITLLFVVPLALIMHYGVVLREERYLTVKFGEPYLELKRAVRRWL